MRKSVSIIALALLAATSACKKSEPVEAVASESAMPTEAAALAPSAPGDYMVTSSDGKPGGMTTINADGSYKDTPPKGLPVAGLVTYKNNKICFDPSGPKEGPECWTETAPAADGSFTATSDKGVTVSVKPKAK